MSTALLHKVYKGETFTEMQSRVDYKLEELYGVPQLYAHRVDLAVALTNMATTGDGDGPPVQITYNAEVTEYDAETGVVHLLTGATYQGDVIVAADGVHSIAPSHIAGHDCPALPTGTTIIRFMLPTASLLTNPRTASLVSSPGQFNIFVAPDRERWLLQYPCRNGELQNFGMYSLKVDEYDVEAQTMRFQCDRESLERELQGFDERIAGVAQIASEILPIWRLQERQALEAYWKGRLVVIG